MSLRFWSSSFLSEIYGHVTSNFSNTMQFWSTLSLFEFRICTFRTIGVRPSSGLHIMIRCYHCLLSSQRDHEFRGISWLARIATTSICFHVITSFTYFSVLKIISPWRIRSLNAKKDTMNGKYWIDGSLCFMSSWKKDSDFFMTKRNSTLSTLSGTFQFLHFGMAVPWVLYPSKIDPVSDILNRP